MFPEKRGMAAGNARTLTAQALQAHAKLSVCGMVLHGYGPSVRCLSVCKDSVSISVQGQRACVPAARWMVGIRSARSSAHLVTLECSCAPPCFVRHSVVRSLCCDVRERRRNCEWSCERSRSTPPRKQPHRAAGSLNPIERAVGRTAGGSINSKRRSAVTDLGGRGGGRRKGRARQHGLPNRVAGVEQL